jgi:outer membrane immunogenic protein
MRNLISVLLAGVGLLAVNAPAMAFDWDGAYIGVITGYTSSSSDSAYDYPLYSGFDITSEPKGWYFGGTAGYNFVLNGSVLLGIEGDIGVADFTDTIVDELGSYPAPNGETVTIKTDYAGTLRARAGFVLDNWVPYVTAGVGFAHTVVTATDGDLEDSATLSGVVAGVGVEYAVSDSITVKAEYLHTSLNDYTWFEGETYSNTGGNDSDSIRVGLNFKF